MSKITRQQSQDKELEKYRSLMEVPGTFEDGFTWSSLAGAIFIALLMIPGAMYMQLLAGMGVGPAAQWVTVILFIEVARRAHQKLRRPEIFVLFYMAGALMAAGQIGTGPVRLLYQQFYVQSKAASGMGIADTIPYWVSPNDPEVLAERSFFNPVWYPALALLIFQTVVGKINSMILGYGLFRLASDIEKLPFPMAPIGAQGLMALAEQQTEEGAVTKNKTAEDGWRWRIFSIGAVIGLAFGALYLFLPTVTGALFDAPISIFPIPFSDWTDKTAKLGLSAVATGLSYDLSQVIVGMVLPFFAMVGSFVGLIITFVANPILYDAGILSSWSPTDTTVSTLFSNNLDFYFSFSIGVAIAIALAGFVQVFKSVRKSRLAKAEQGLRDTDDADPFAVPEGRGDISFPWVIGTYVFTASLYIIVSGFLIDWHPGVMVVMLFFAFAYTPIISYVTARLEGLAGQVVQIPMIREAAFILSGYRGGVAIWFLPIPLANYGAQTVFYRQAELTGTSFWSIWKTTIFLVPLILVASVLFANFIWSLSEIPGPAYPYADMMWELNAANQSLIYSSTLGRFSTFEQAFNWHYLAFGTGFGVIMFMVMSFISAPIMLTYGVVRGLNQTMPHTVVPQFIGALIGRYYFEKRMGVKWRQYAPVIAAGYACGAGLITIFGVGIVFLTKSVIKIAF
jgi:hypothetical protein